MDLDSSSAMEASRTKTRSLLESNESRDSFSKYTPTWLGRSFSSLIMLMQSSTFRLNLLIDFVII